MTPTHNGHYPLVNQFVSGVFPAPPAADFLQRLEQIVANQSLSRRDLFDRAFGTNLDPRRDVAQECGHPATNSLTPRQFQEFFDRDAVANRVVTVFPRECWQAQPTVYEAEDAEEKTAFEKAWDGLSRQLRGDYSYYADEAGSPIWEYLCRADEQSGIGQYCIVLLGIDDGKSLDQPAALVKKGKGGVASRKLLYLRVFPEALLQITQWDRDQQSPRFGQPVLYMATFNDPQQEGTAPSGLPLSTVNVHWTRVVHVADNLTSSEVFGVPRMLPVLNRLLDLQKVYGADAEAYWKNALIKLLLKFDADGAPVDQQAVKDAVENFANSLQPYLALGGAEAQTVAPAVADPTPHVLIQIEAICIKLGIPRRVFMGSERGELASTQDDAAWNDRLRQRQEGYVTPRVIVPFVDRLIALGVLPEPAAGYRVEWPDLDSLTDADKAKIALTRTQAMAAYVSGGLESLIPPMDYLTRELGYDEDEAQAIIDATTAAAEEQAAQDAQLADEHGMVPAPPDGFQHPPEPKPDAQPNGQPAGVP